MSAIDNNIYSVKNLFGQFETPLQVFARSLAEKLKIKHSIDKPILINIGLRKDQIENFSLLKQIENQIVQSYL